MSEKNLHDELLNKAGEAVPQKPCPDTMETVQKNLPVVRTLLEGALMPSNVSSQAIEQKPYKGPTPSETFVTSDAEFMEGTELAVELIREMNKQFAQHPPSMECIHLFANTMCDGLEEDESTDLKKIFIEFMEGCIKNDISAKALKVAVINFVNKEILIWGGGFLPSDILDQEDDMDVMSSIRGVHEMQRFDSPMGEIEVLYTDSISGRRGKVSSDAPHYDRRVDLVHMPCLFIVEEATNAALHGKSGAHAKRLQDIPGINCREVLIDAEYYKSLWKRHGTPDLGSRIAASYSSSNPNRRILEKYKETGLYHAINSVTLAEELRHSIDSRYEKKIHGEQGSETNPSFMSSSVLFHEDSMIREGFLKAGNKEAYERKKLNSAMHELIAKMTACAVCTDPKLLIDHLKQVLNTSRIRTAKKSQTFRDDLTSQESKDEVSGHSLASKIAATMFGRHFGMPEAGDLHIDASYDYLALCKIFEKIASKTPEELRLAVCSMMNPQLMIPVDCAPFPQIDDQGRVIMAI